jgi:hypothetical protein
MKLKLIVTLAATSLGAAVLLVQPDLAMGKKPRRPLPEVR